MALVTPIIRITLSDERVLRMHLPTINQQLELDADRLPETAEDSRARFEKLLHWLRVAVVEQSWDGDVGDGLALQEIEALITRWMLAAEDQAFPLAPESSSEIPSAEQLSEVPTAGASQSPTRRSRKSSRKPASGASRRGK